MDHQEFSWVDPFGENLVSWARQGNLEAVQRCLDLGQDINLQGKINSFSCANSVRYLGI